MLWSAFLFGLLGSFHCVGMCGAIALSIPMDFSTRLRLLKDAVAYNAGRIITYSLIGLTVGFFGQAFFQSGYQQALAIELGVLMLLLYFLPKQWGDKLAKAMGLTYLTGQIKRSFSALLRQPGRGTILLIGMLNGLLPCGFIYMAAAAAVLAGSPGHSMAYMALFGLGTAPMMFLTATSRQFVSMRIRNHIKTLKPYLAVTVALLFILRGLSLGIPYLSPKLPAAQAGQTAQSEVMCHGQ
jgi:uncharacterized protein